MPTRIDPVDREGFGIAYLEAAMHGVPSIASRMPGVDEAVLHNETGLLIDSDDDLLRALVLLAGDQALRERLGAAARHRAKTQFHPDAQLKKIRDLL